MQIVTKVHAHREPRMLHVLYGYADLKKRNGVGNKLVSSDSQDAHCKSGNQRRHDRTGKIRPPYVISARCPFPSPRQYVCRFFGFGSTCPNTDEDTVKKATLRAGTSQSNIAAEGGRFRLLMRRTTMKSGPTWRWAKMRRRG